MISARKTTRILLSKLSTERMATTRHRCENSQQESFLLGRFLPRDMSAAMRFPHHVTSRHVTSRRSRHFSCMSTCPPCPPTCPSVVAFHSHLGILAHHKHRRRSITACYLQRELLDLLPELAVDRQVDEKVADVVDEVDVGNVTWQT